MNFLKKLFVRTPEDHLAKGDALLAEGSFFEARNSYEKGLDCCGTKAEYADLSRKIGEKIDEANRSLAHLNIEEAEHARRRGADAKAEEHLELALTLTQDPAIRKKVELLLAGLAAKSPLPVAAPAAASCSSCSTHGSPQPEEIHLDTGSDLDISVQYELLIHQLPQEMYERYARLGEDFAEMFVTASHDQHAEALELLEKCFHGSDRDIFCYEKGRILHRLGRNRESETYLLESIRENVHNPLPHLALALLFMEGRRLDEAARKLDAMISADIFTGQALMMRGEVFEMSGDLDGAMNLYGRLLETPLVRAAAEKLHGLLIASDRDQEAAQVFKRYLGKCKH